MSKITTTEEELLLLNVMLTNNKTNLLPDRWWVSRRSLWKQTSPVMKMHLAQVSSWHPRKKDHSWLLALYNNMVWKDMAWQIKVGLRANSEADSRKQAKISKALLKKSAYVEEPFEFHTNHTFVSCTNNFFQLQLGSLHGPFWAIWSACFWGWTQVGQAHIGEYQKSYVIEPEAERA